jgi:2-phosphoglycerate kinase
VIDHQMGYIITQLVVVPNLLKKKKFNDRHYILNIFLKNLEKDEEQRKKKLMAQSMAETEKQ